MCVYIYRESVSQLVSQSVLVSQFSAVIMRSNVTWYCIQHCSHWSRTYFSVLTYKTHSISLLWRITRKSTALKQTHIFLLLFINSPLLATPLDVARIGPAARPPLPLTSDMRMAGAGTSPDIEIVHLEMCRGVKLHWIFTEAPLNFNGAPENIQGNCHVWM